MNRLPWWRFVCACMAAACNGTTPFRAPQGEDDQDEISIDANPRIVSGSFFAEPTP